MLPAQDREVNGAWWDRLTPLWTGVFSGLFAGVGWGAAMWLLIWRPENTPLLRVVIVTALFGLLTGVSAASHRARAIRLKQPL
jgi:hypothetical protein